MTRTGQAIAALIFAVGMITGISLTTWLIGYQTSVTRELVAEWGKRINQIEVQYRQDHKSGMRTTAGQASVIVDRLDKERRP